MVRPFFRRVLADVDRFCMQSEESARRLIDLGADPSRVTVTGSLKFDSLELPTATAHGKPRQRVLRFFRISPNRTVIVAGSTMRGEETAVLQAFARVKAAMPSALAVLAPRQPERFGEVERIAREAGFVAMRRSELPIDAEPRADVVVLDSIGELAELYQLATAVFVGGSLVDQAGTTSSSRRSSGSRSSSGRTCRTSRKSPTRFSPTAPRCRCSPSASSRKCC